MQFKDIKFYLVRHGNDYVYGFDIDARFHGYTLDKFKNFHVFDEQTKAYTTYETIPAFGQFLASKQSGNGDNKNKYAGRENIIYTGMPETMFGGFNMTPIIIIGAVLLIGWLIVQK